MQGMHEFVRCMTSVEGESKVVVVGDNGAAQHAATSQQLASALSLSIWDLADSAAPVLTTLVTNQQVGYLLFCRKPIPWLSISLLRFSPSSCLYHTRSQWLMRMYNVHTQTNLPSLDGQVWCCV